MLLIKQLLAIVIMFFRDVADAMLLTSLTINSNFSSRHSKKYTSTVEAVYLLTSTCIFTCITSRSSDN